VNRDFEGKVVAVTGASTGLGREQLRNSVIPSTTLQAASTAEDIASAAVFLASPAAPHVTGEILLVDAGLHLGFARLVAR